MPMAPTLPASPSPGPGSSLPPRPGPAHAALAIPRFFVRDGRHPFETVEWERRDALIQDEEGRVLFEQKGVEFPAAWSETAGAIVASKYFHGSGEGRESSLRQLIGRVADTLANWGEEAGWFATAEDALAFRHELAFLLLDQRMAFNSPVWFNVGIEARPQCSACFINSVDDSMESILDLVKTEGRLFKYGSGTGTNFSRLRAGSERLSGGGTASGPVSFMRGFDSFAGVIKSGGKTRRAAKMVILDADHPDILEFIRCKAEEEKKAGALAEAGYDPGFNVPGGAYDSVQFQNANHSVRVPDAFMQAALEGRDWETTARVDGRPMGRHDAAALLIAMAEAAWVCGDPGLQFDTAINSWHTCPESGRINASNPCSEYMFLDDSACNLASLNLMKFRRPGSRPGEWEFDVAAFQQAVDVTLLAQEILVDRAGYPTAAIERNSREYRPLGLGYANLGALLMSRGLPYDGEEGRNFAAAVTALMHGRANAMSARMAGALGPFSGFARNRAAMLGVMGRHAAAARALDASGVPPELLLAAGKAWDEALALGKRNGYRNAQVTVLAPTGTIAFMMDCDTTGVEPDIALVKYKRMVGGGMLRMVNRSVGEALRRLGYGSRQSAAMLAHLEKAGTLEGAPHLKEAHLPVFDCAFPAAKGGRSIPPSGHLRMMAAVQPFLSGAISKTVNLPAEAGPEAIREVFVEAWKLGLKSVAVYRDGSKRTQPLSTSAGGAGRPARRRLPDERRSITHKFSIAGHEGYVTVGMFEDGAPGEVFIVMAKEGSVISGLLDSFATAVSLALQYGVPLKVFVEKFRHGRYEPSGFTQNPQIRMATSITDYIFRWLALKFPTAMGGSPSDAGAGDFGDALPGMSADPAAPAIALPPDPEAPEAATAAAKKRRAPRDASAADPAARDAGIPGASATGLASPGVAGFPPAPMQLDAPPCPDCGSLMIRAGSCYRCGNCGGTSGCS